MATELSRRSFVIPDTGEPVFVIEQGRAGGDTPDDNYSRWKVVTGNRTLRSDLTSEEAALNLAEGMGAVETFAGDERAMAAEIGGTAVLQAALAPRVSELAAEFDNGFADLDRKVMAAQPLEDDEQAAHDEVAAAVGEGTRVPDSQATGVMEITTGLGGLRRHGLGERFEGASENAVKLAAGALTADGATEDEKRGARPRSSATAAKGKTPAARKRPSRAKPKATAASGSNTSAQTDAEKARDGDIQNPSVAGHASP